MALNTSHTPNNGVLIYNGEMILLYEKEANLEFVSPSERIMKGKFKDNISQQGSKKSTSIILYAISLLEEGHFGTTYFRGELFETTRNRPANAPPPYTPPTGGYFNPPPTYYMQGNRSYHGFTAPVNVFPDAPPASDVYMYEAPPPYEGIGGGNAGNQNLPPYPAGAAASGGGGYGNMPPYPSSAAAGGSSGGGGNMSKEEEAARYQQQPSAPPEQPPPPYPMQDSNNGVTGPYQRRH